MTPDSVPVPDGPSELGAFLRARRGELDPGTAKSLANWSAAPLFIRLTSVHQLMVSFIENVGSLTP